MDKGNVSDDGGEGSDLSGDIQREGIEINRINVLYDKENLGYVWCKSRKRVYKTTGEINYYNEIGGDKTPRIEVCDNKENCKEIKACKCYGVSKLPNNFDYNKYIKHLK